jgi:isochorismate hydrolase
MIDLQEKFRPHIADIDRVVANANVLNKATELLNIPLLMTEQYPKGLGKTFNDIYQPKNSVMFEKTRFSIFDEENISHIYEANKHQMIIYGIETHVCVMQTVLDALERNYIPIVVIDAVSSISSVDKEIAIKRMLSEGVVVVSTEMLLFELIKDANHPNFKEISNLVKNR